MEHDLISRSAVLDVINKERRFIEELRETTFDNEDRAHNTGELGCAIRLARQIKDLPAIDAVSVVHARWIYSGDMDLDGNSQGYCSRCGAGDKHRADLKNFVPYCWKCGARMDAEEDTNGHQND